MNWVMVLSQPRFLGCQPISATRRRAEASAGSGVNSAAFAA